MGDPDLIELFIRPLERLSIPYMITGGVASVIYGDPRFTRDIDLVMEIHPEKADRLVSAFEPLEFYVPPVEVIREESNRLPGGHFNIIHRNTSLRADVYVLDDEPLHAWGFMRRIRLGVGEIEVSIAPIEYVILRKLQYFRDSGSDRHLRDVSMMFQISDESIDQPELSRWVDDLGLTDALAEAKAFQP